MPTKKTVEQSEKCCVCGKRKAVNIPRPDGKPYYVNMGACDKSACILKRMRDVR